jgi:hypothetical protein
MNRFGSFFKPLMWSMALLLAAVAAGCGGGGGGSGTTGSSTSAGAAGGVCTGGAACVSLGAGSDLAAAAGYVILAKTGVSTVPSSVVTGNVGLSPAARTFLTDWSETADSSDTFSTSAQVVAPFRLYAANYAAPTPTNLTNAVLSMEAAYTAATAKTSTAACPGTGNFGGLTLTTGVYTCAVNVTIPTSVTLNGSATDVWVFQITGKLDQSSATQVLLTGGALPQNVFWQVSDVVTIGTTATIRGVVLAKTNIAVQTGATVIGRLQAQTAVTLDKATVTQPTS